MTVTASKGYICVFACRWCALLGVERAGRERLSLPPRLRVMPVACAGSVSADSVVEALVNGAAGVAVLGCHLGGCRHNEANRDAHVRLRVLADLLDTIGMDGRRLLISWGTAHEAEGYARLMRDFAARIDALPAPSEAASTAPAARGTPSSPLAASSASPPSSPQEDAELRARVEAALEDGHAVLALRRTAAGVVPSLFTPGSELDALAAGPKFPLAGTAARILRDMEAGALRGGVEEAVLRAAVPARTAAGGLRVACRACDARALRELAALRQFSRELPVPIPVPCSPEQIAACACERPEWPDSEALPARTPSQDRTAGLRERERFWQEQFSRCVRCHWCRAVCPVCVCPACALEDNAFLPAGALPPSPLGYHLVRAMHVADVCVGCGACQDACPQGLPLLDLHRSASRTLREFGYASGLNTASPLRGERHGAGAAGSAAPQWLSGLESSGGGRA